MSSPNWYSNACRYMYSLFWTVTMYVMHCRLVKSLAKFTRIGENTIQQSLLLPFFYIWFDISSSLGVFAEHVRLTIALLSHAFLFPVPFSPPTHTPALVLPLCLRTSWSSPPGTGKRIVCLWTCGSRRWGGSARCRWDGKGESWPLRMERPRSRRQEGDAMAAMDGKDAIVAARDGDGVAMFIAFGDGVVVTAGG